nr:MAG TPA: hypothetical protein [Crassvirales sp.]
MLILYVILLLLFHVIFMFLLFVNDFIYNYAIDFIHIVII